MDINQLSTDLTEELGFDCENYLTSAINQVYAMIKSHFTKEEVMSMTPDYLSEVVTAALKRHFEIQKEAGEIALEAARNNPEEFFSFLK